MAVCAGGRDQPGERLQPTLPDGPPDAGAAPTQESEQPEAIVLLKDGRRITGLLVERTREAVVLKVGGIATRLPADIIDRVEVLPPVLERYQQMRDAIDDDDPDQLVQLAEWLRSRARFDLAIKELLRALEVRPGHPEATRLLTLVRGQRELASRAGSGDRGAPRPAGAPAPAVRPDFPVLSPDQINTIKVYEIDLKSPPDLLVDRDTMTRLMERHSGDPSIPPTAEGREALYRLAPARQVELIFKLQARELYPEIRVIGQPHSMTRFRDEVHRPWIVNSCATTRCHGGEEAGRLYLSNRRPNSEATVYTNFLILERFRLPDDSPLLDYDEPARSALLQMALPRRDSLVPHPIVPGPDGRGDLWRPAIRSTDDRRFQQAVEWMKSMYRPRPQYPVDYQPPKAVAAEAALPATPAK